MHLNVCRKITTTIVLVGSALVATQAWAGGVSLSLVRSSLNNVDDAAGRWQHEGGKVLKGATTIGTYVITRRVTMGGTDPYNAAFTTVHLMLPVGTALPPQNLTLQGTHNFSNGYFYGGVSAASNRYTFTCNGQAVIIPTATLGTSTLTVYWNGDSQLTLP